MTYICQFVEFNPSMRSLNCFRVIYSRNNAMTLLN